VTLRRRIQRHHSQRPVRSQNAVCAFTPR